MSPNNFLNPREIVDQLEILPGMKVAHFGCGTGYFTFPIAEKIQNEGVVYALDVRSAKIEIIKSQAKALGLRNVIGQVANLEEREGSKLSANDFDWVIIVNMLFQNEKKTRIILEAKRILKPGGKILLIEWNEDKKAIGPDPECRISKKELIKISRKNGLGITKELEASAFHNALVLTK